MTDYRPVPERPGLRMPACRKGREGEGRERLARTDGWKLENLDRRPRSKNVPVLPCLAAPGCLASVSHLPQFPGICGIAKSESSGTDYRRVRVSGSSNGRLETRKSRPTAPIEKRPRPAMPCRARMSSVGLAPSTVPGHMRHSKERIVRD